MKRFLMAVMSVFFALAVYADDEFGLYVVTDSETKTTEVSSLQKITFSNGNVVVQTKDGTSTSTAMSDVTKMYFDYIKSESGLFGDVNEDGNVDISDIVAVINQIAGMAIYRYADVNGDEGVDISDIVAIINIIASAGTE
jgi:hypothetical protein